MTAYLVADVEWHDAEELEKYSKGHSQLLAKYGGRILIGSRDIEVVEGEWKPRLLVIFEFPDRKAFHSWYESSEYAPQLARRRKYADSNVVVAE